MQRFYYKITALILVVSLTACGGKDQLTQKKNELEKLKKEQTSLTDKIKNLETDIAKLDTSVKKDDIAKLVGVSDVTAQNFVHYIDLQTM
jgi:peptidoglycan hydrolase CwlO-like protein